MDKKEIQIAGHTVTQLTETEYEAENKGQELDFYFDTGNPAAVEVFVFDSRISTQGEQGPNIATFYAADLEEAVRKAMALTRRSLQGTSRQYNVVERLREISRRLESVPDADAQMALFPGWDDEHSEEPESAIKRAARAILAEGVSPDEGSMVSYKELAALIHYIADMME